MKNSEWVQDKEDRILKLEQALEASNLGVFVGTMEECKEALANGVIKNGMLAVSTKLK